MLYQYNYLLINKLFSIKKGPEINCIIFNMPRIEAALLSCKATATC